MTMTTTVSTFRRSSSRASYAVGSSTATLHVRCSTRADGDFHRTAVPLGELEARRRHLVDLPWTMLDQRHGTSVVDVARPGDGDGEQGDIAVTSCDDAVLGCWVGDCAPVVLVGAGRRFAVVHAGWRGLAAGVIDRAVDSLGEPLAGAVVGPAIGPCCYEFGSDDLDSVATGVHADRAAIAGTTRAGELALDVTAAVRSAVRQHGVEPAAVAGCTGCVHPGFSHRARRDPERHVVAAWRPSRTAR